mgnify:CR=1 FL=1
MKEFEIKTRVQAYEHTSQLPPLYAQLLEEARSALSSSYAPYSKFHVGAAVRMKNGKTLKGANQENAAYPICLCAERVALGNALTELPHGQVIAMAITVQNDHHEVSAPAAPCGSCRQAILEQEIKQNAPIKLILQGSIGKIYVINSAKEMLPLGFDGSYL